MASDINTSLPLSVPGKTYGDPALYQSILLRRTLAFAIDVTLILLFTVSAILLVTLLGLVTFGLAWLFLGLVFPAVALGYYGLTLGVQGSTPGMNAIGLELLAQDNTRLGPLRAIAHAILFWITVVTLTPLVLLIGLFNERRRLLHDIVLDCTLVNRNILLSAR